MMLGVILAGCELPNSSEVPPQADSGPPAPPPITRTLTVLSDRSLTLEAGSMADLQWSLRDDDGEAVADEEITLAMVGRADDSSLSESTVYTDGLGEATGRILAGTQPATFRVRATAPQAAPTFIDVSVSATGFGNVVITTDYDGRHSLEAYRLELLSGVPCSDENLAEAAPERELRAAGDGSAEFAGLPAATTITVRGWGVNADGYDVAYGCIDDIEVVEGETRERTLTVVDMPLILEGRYSLELNIESSDSSAVASESLGEVRRRFLDLHGSDASFLLDALHRSLADEGDVATAGYLEVLIDSGEAEREIAARLGDDQGTSRLLTRVASTAAARVAAFSLEGILVFSAEEPGLATWMTESVTLPSSGADDPLRIPATDLTSDASGVVRATLGDREDQVTVLEHALLMPLSGLVAESWVSAVGEFDPSAPEGSGVAREIGCGALGEWVSTRPSLAATCETRCVNLACRRAVREVLSTVSTGLMSLDARRTTMTFNGDLIAEDTDGDRYPDTLSGDDWEGGWSAPLLTESDSLTAIVSGERDHRFGS